jgi:V/A-type H+-transporting ATPase subunit K
MALMGILTLLCAAGPLAVAGAQAHGGEDAALAEAISDAQSGHTPLRWDLSVAIAVAIGVPSLAAGYAVGRIGAAALGAASEKPELLTRSLLFVALAEGIAIYGLLVAVLLYVKL